MVVQERPLLVMVGFTCTNWCANNTRFNFKGERSSILEARQKDDEPMLRLMAWTMNYQSAQGRLFLFENPTSSLLWHHPLLQTLIKSPTTLTGTGHGCPYGLCGVKGGLLFKHWKWMTNHALLLQAVTRKCCNTKACPDHTHEAIEGQNTNLSGGYPDDLCRAILEALRSIAHTRDPYRFTETRPLHPFAWNVKICENTWVPPGAHVNSHDVFYLDVNKDVSVWEPLLIEAGKILQSRPGLPAVDLVEGDSLWTRISTLVPWEVTRVQLAKLPKTRRLPTGLMATHRCAVLIDNEGEIFIESEHLGAALPRGKLAYQYPRPIRHALFIFGYAPEDSPAVRQETTENDDRVEGIGPASKSGLKYSSDIWFEGLNKYNAPADVRSIVARLHLNYGHPSKEDLLRFCAVQGASATTLAVVSALRCNACARNVSTSNVRHTRLPKVGQFNDRVSLDIVHVKDVVGLDHLVLGAIDRATWLDIHMRCESRDPDVVYAAFQGMWLIPYGLPLEALVDEDGCFQGEFLDNLQMLGVAVRYVPPGGHHQLGQRESNNYFWRCMLHRVIDARAIFETKDLDLAILSCDNAKNTMLKRCGRSPYQAVMGRAPRLPSELLSDESNVYTYQNVRTSAEGLQLADYYRLDALRAFIDEEQHGALATGMRAKTVARKEGFEVGSKVAYWREQGPKRPNGKRARRAGYLIGTFAGYEMDPARPEVQGNNCWVMTPHGLKKVTREQLRHAHGFEQWEPDRDDIKGLAQFEHLRRHQVYEDAREAGPRSDESSEPAVRSSPIPEGSIPEPLPYPLGARSDASGGLASVVPTSSVPDLDVDGSPVGSEAPMLEEPGLTELSDLEGEATVPWTGPLQESPDVDYPEAKRPKVSAEVSIASGLATNFAGEICLCIPDGSDTDLTYRGGFHGVTNYSELPQVLASDETHQLPQGQLQEVMLTEQADSDCDTSEPDYAEVFEAGSNVSEDSDTEPPLSRKDQKALEREIPWREIYNGPKARFQKYVEATRKEVNAFHKWATVKPVSDARVNEIYRDPQQRRRILRARNCFRNKNAAKGEHAEELAKCRCVLLGCFDPDLTHLERYAPTATTTGFWILLQIYSTGVLDPRGPWLMATGDVETAFLQGGPGAERKEPLYMAPLDPIAIAAGAFAEAKLWEVVGNVYGLANAPHNFFLVVRDKMVILGFRSHSLDVCLYLFFSTVPSAIENDLKSGLPLVLIGQTLLLEAAVLFHVDDMLAAFSPSFNHKDLYDAFSWGDPWEWSPKSLKWNGYELEFDDQLRVKVHQTTFTTGTTVRKVPSTAREDHALQKGPEMTEFKSCGGSLNWLAGKTRVDIAAGASLYQKGSPTLEDLRGLYKLVAYAQSTKDAGIVLNPVPWCQMIIVDITDSSWANAEELKSQMGFLVVATTYKALSTGAYGSLLEFKSFRSKRCLRSTLAAEAAAKDAGVDHATFLNAFLSECLTGVKAKDQEPVFQHFSVTDCKCLYDAVRQATPSLSEKRTIIDLTATRDSLAKDHLLWIPTHTMLADGLTKVTPDLMATLTRFMSHCWIDLKGSEG